MRYDHPVFRRRRFFRGTASPHHPPDIGWFRANGAPMVDSDWHDLSRHTLGVFLNGHAIESRDKQGRPIVDDSFYWMINAAQETVEFVFPPNLESEWNLVLHTGGDIQGSISTQAGQRSVLQDRSMKLWKRNRDWKHDA